MKKILLALSLMCALPLSAMQDPVKDHVKKETGKTLWVGGMLLTASSTPCVVATGCALMPLTAFVGGVYAMKKGYDWYYKQELLDQVKGK